MSNLKLIVGLGNPGKEYQATRHNIGFSVIDNYLDKNNISFDKNKFNGIFIKTRIFNQDVIIAKPLTYMNLSGEFVANIKSFFNISIPNILVIYDDKDLNSGAYKLRPKGSSGGQNGMKNIINHLKTQDVKRLKIGIGSDKPFKTRDYVLQKFSKDQKKLLNEVIDLSTKIIDDFIKDSDFTKLMNDYN